MSADVDSIRGRLDLDHIALLAGAVASKIAGDGWAAVELCPGDMTRYHVIVTPNEAMREEPEGDATWDVIGRGWIVTLANCSGRSWQWDGSGGLHPSYVTNAWTTDGHLWTGVVLAEFLNRLAEQLERS